MAETSYDKIPLEDALQRRGEGGAESGDDDEEDDPYTLGSADAAIDTIVDGPQGPYVVVSGRR